MLLYLKSLEKPGSSQGSGVKDGEWRGAVLRSTRRRTVKRLEASALGLKLRRDAQ